MLASLRGGGILGLVAVLAVTMSCGVNNPPVLQPIASPQIAFVGNRLEITLLAYDPDGDPLTFGFRSLGTAIGSGARIVTLGDRGIFSWTAGASDVGEHQIAFAVSDGKQEATQATTIIVKPGTSANTAPVFRRPLGYGKTLDLEHKKCIDIDVLVEDPDSVTVEITQDPPIEGSTLSHVGAMAAIFHWCPTEAQKKRLQYLLRLVAKDADHPPVTKDFMIVLRVPLPKTCPGTAPQIAHSPPGPETTLDPLSIQATVTDDLGLKDAPYIYFSTNAPPPGDVDVSTWDQLKMTEKSAGFFGVSLPNPLKGLPGGSQKTLYYVILAEDDDDRNGDCDHRTQAPKGGAFSIVLTAPDSTKTCTKLTDCLPGKICNGETCVKDACTPVDTNGDKLYWEQGSCPSGYFCPVGGSDITASHCAATCLRDSDCGTGRVCKVFDTKSGCGSSGTKEIGDACVSFEECTGKQMCMPWAGGYCVLSDCDSGGMFSGVCPAGSACYPMPDTRMWGGKHWICVKTCTTSANCRQVAGYECREIQDDKKKTHHVCLPKGTP